MSCEFKDHCLSFLGDFFEECGNCKWSDGSEGGSRKRNNWIGYGDYSGMDHPSLAKFSSQRASKRTKTATKKENNHISSLQTSVKKSSNSGRVRKDGDYTDETTLYDYKFQDAINVTIKMVDVDKAIGDALRSAKKDVVLIIENKQGRKFEVRELLG